MMQKFLESELVRSLLWLHLPRYGELPTLDLYMDQVISVIDDALHPLFPESAGPVLTPTMIHNYVKQKVVSPPVKKRYTKNHLVYFIVVALLKPVFSIAEISALIHRQTQGANAGVAYDRFCTELEQALHGAFSSRQLVPDPAEGCEPDAELVRSAVMSLVNKIFVEKFLEYAAMRRSEREPAARALPAAGAEPEK